jgi:hypothetical protein
MPIIQFNESEFMQNKVIEAGIYPSEVTKIDGPKASSSGKSNHYFVTIAVTDGKYKGKEVTAIFNSEAKTIQMWGEAMSYPTFYFLLINDAIKGKETPMGKVSLDVEELLHKPFDAQWTVSTVEGRLVNTVSAFFPKGYAAKAPAF